MRPSQSLLLDLARLGIHASRRFSQVPNMAPVLGELAFFLGIVQPMAVRTRPDGDVQLLVLSKDDSNSLFDSYPEQVTRISRFLWCFMVLFSNVNEKYCFVQLEIICANILSSFGLDRDGKELSQVFQIFTQMFATSKVCPKLIKVA